MKEKTLRRRMWARGSTRTPPSTPALFSASTFATGGGYTTTLQYFICSKRQSVHKKSVLWFCKSAQIPLRYFIPIDFEINDRKQKNPSTIFFTFSIFFFFFFLYPVFSRNKGSVNGRIRTNSLLLQYSNNLC